MTLTPKERMLRAYRGEWWDTAPVAPELWYYYPAKMLGVDMIEFEREVPFHRALESAFTAFGCEGWGAVFAGVPNDRAAATTVERWIDADTLEAVRTVTVRGRELTSRQRYSRTEPSWVIERPVKRLETDLIPWAEAAMGGDVGAVDTGRIAAAWDEVGESYLLEGWLGVPFFDFYGGAREGGFEQAAVEFLDPEMETTLLALRDRYTEYLVSLARVLCERTPLESLCIGCSWSCNSLEGPDLWRKWDKQVIAAAAREVHGHGKLLHIHFHGRSIETAADFAETGVDCVCPFERPPGGDVAGIEGLRTVRRLMGDRVTMNGNVHTVETLIRGTPDDVRREVGEIVEAFAGTPRFIIGTGDQVGRETPEENLYAMIEEGRRLTRR